MSILRGVHEAPAELVEKARVEKFLAVARKRQRGLVVVLQDPDRRRIHDGNRVGSVGCSPNVNE